MFWKYFGKTFWAIQRLYHLQTPVITHIGVREGILLGRRKKIALKITICPENSFFSLIQMEAEISCKSVLYSWIRL